MSCGLGFMTLVCKAESELVLLGQQRCVGTTDILPGPLPCPEGRNTSWGEAGTDVRRCGLKEVRPSPVKCSWESKQLPLLCWEITPGHRPEVKKKKEKSHEKTMAMDKKVGMGLEQPE